MKYIKCAFGWILILACLCPIFWIMGGNYKPKTKYIIPNIYEWQSPTKLILADNGVEDVENCLAWAFGENFRQLQQSELDDKWRERHSDLFEIAGYDCIVESTKKIAEAWKLKN